MTDALDARLREIRYRQTTTDPLLNMLAGIATRGTSAGPQYGVVLATAGGTFKGVPVPSEKFAAKLDEETRWFLKVLRAIAIRDGGDAEAWDEQLAESHAVAPFSQVVQKDAEEEKEVDDYLDAATETPKAPADFPEDLVDAAVRAFSPVRAITLESAQVMTRDGAWDELGSCRVVLSQVTAWWTFRLAAPDDVRPEDLT